MTSTLDDNLKMLDRLFLLIYGPPKSGKTVTVHGLPRTRTLDFDDGMGSVMWAIKKGIIRRKPNEIVFSTIKPPVNEKKGKPVLDQATAQIDEWLAEEDIDPKKWDKPYPQFWDTLIIDSATFLTEAVIVKGLKENQRLGLSKSWEHYSGEIGTVRPMRMQDWGSGSTLFWKFMEWILTIGKNVAVCAHEYHNIDENGSTISIDPLVIGQLRQRLPALFDEVWYQTVTGSSANAKYVIQTVRDLKRNLGSRLGCLDPKETADFEAMKDKIAKFYGVPKKNLWTAYHGTEGAEKASREAEEAAVTV